MQIQKSASEVRKLARDALHAIEEFRASSPANAGARLAQEHRCRAIHSFASSAVAQQKVMLDLDDWLALSQLP